MFRGYLSVTWMSVALLAAASSAAPAQNSVVAPPPPTREDTVGPEQLRGFSLGGNAQRPEEADSPAPQPQASARSAERPVTAPDLPAAREPSAEQQRPTEAAPARTQQQGAAASPGKTVPAASGTQPSSQVSLALPPPTPAPTSSFDFNGGLGTGSPIAPTVTSPPATGSDKLPLWPWLLAAAVVVAAGLFLWTRRKAAEDRLDRQSLAFAGPAPAPPRPASPAPRPAAPPVQRAPEPAQPRPAIAPAPAAPSNPKGLGIVSTRLRPWLDVEVAVAAAILTEEDLQLHLQLSVANSGSTPARQVGVEVVALNAGPEQDAELKTYFARPDPDPRAAEMIAPLDSATLQTVVRMPRASFREYAAGEGRVIVPLIAINVAYRAGSNLGRTSTALLVGRANPNSDKLGPLRTDQGPREYRGIVARPLGIGVRR